MSAPTKPWWHSRVLWLNVAAAGLMALEAGWGVLQPHLPVNFWVGMSVGLPIINAMLRVVTTYRLTLGKGGAND